MIEYFKWVSFFIFILFIYRYNPFVKLLARFLDSNCDIRCFLGIHIWEQHSSCYDGRSWKECGRCMRVHHKDKHKF